MLLRNFHNIKILGSGVNYLVAKKIRSSNKQS